MPATVIFSSYDDARPFLKLFQVRQVRVLPRLAPPRDWVDTKPLRRHLVSVVLSQMHRAIWLQFGVRDSSNVVSQGERQNLDGCRCRGGLCDSSENTVTFKRVVGRTRFCVHVFPNR